MKRAIVGNKYNKPPTSSLGSTLKFGSGFGGGGIGGGGIGGDGSKLKAKLPSSLVIACSVGVLCLITTAILLGDHHGTSRALSIKRSGKMPVSLTQKELKRRVDEYLKCQADPKCDDGTPKKKDPLPHDYPGHPWHWTRENEPDPTVGRMSDCNGVDYTDLYEQFHKKGYVVFQSCTIKTNRATLDRTANFAKTIGLDREQDFPLHEVKDISVDPDTLQFIRYLHGGSRPFPFQTLNFPRGTNQDLHSDLIHFDSYPRTRMTAAWVALQDMGKDNGPLRYVPGSHHMGTWDFDEIELTNRELPKQRGLGKNDFERLHDVYGKELEVMLKEQGLEVELGYKIKRGETFIWAAGLLHGGSPVTNPDAQRLSQVTHYYFEGADYYWVPRKSNLDAGQIELKERPLPCKISEKDEDSCAAWHIEKWMDICPRGLAGKLSLGLKCRKEETSWEKNNIEWVIRPKEERFLTNEVKENDLYKRMQQEG